MKSEHKEYVLELLFDRLEILDMRSEQDWIEADDPKGNEMKLLSEIIANF